MYPIPLNASLLAFVDPSRRTAFMERWQREVHRLSHPAPDHSAAVTESPIHPDAFAAVRRAGYGVALPTIDSPDDME
ncbi:hypothetical protein [Chromohalobacter canadensis]|uniref:hypothetical protein n=1 Tax=Chromohalobacter canadensis TaxID=141389 RepID=UPI001FE8E37D|nr:hypothetical protein [Chromohalobacter canadensis]